MKQSDIHQIFRILAHGKTTKIRNKGKYTPILYITTFTYTLRGKSQ
jgi:hypothetical protein